MEIILGVSMFTAIVLALVLDVAAIATGEPAESISKKLVIKPEILKPNLTPIWQCCHV